MWKRGNPLDLASLYTDTSMQRDSHRRSFNCQLEMELERSHIHFKQVDLVSIISNTQEDTDVSPGG